MSHTYYIADGTENHIGKNTWKRLSKKQKYVIRNDRKNAAKYAAAFIREKELRVSRSKKS